MEHLANRCATVAAAALAVAGLVTALTPTTQSAPEVQIRDFGLAAANVDPSWLIDTVENHVRADLSGTGPETQQFNLGELLLGAGNGDVGDGSTLNIGELAESELGKLLGGGLDPQSLVGTSPLGPDLGVLTVPSVSGFSSGAEQSAATAAASALSSLAMALPSLPAVYQSFTSAVESLESDLNSSLVAAQQEAASHLSGGNPDVNDVVNWIFSLNNTVLAHNENAFNSILGINYDAESSLLGNVNPGVAEADWSTLLGFSPDEFHELVNAIQADNLSLLMGNIDWTGLFGGLF